MRMNRAIADVPAGIIWPNCIRTSPALTLTRNAAPFPSRRTQATNFTLILSSV